MPKTQSSRIQTATARTRGRVLLITDDPAVSCHDQVFDPAEVEIVGVTTGVAALVALQRSRPHVVIASDCLTGVSANEIARILAQIVQGSPLLIIGNEPATIAKRKDALAKGAFDYYQLPQETELLVMRTRQLVDMQLTLDRLRSEADLDALTGLANRRRFRTALNREVERWRRYGVPCALLLLDIDHMKSINDRFGHPTGDVVIRRIADVLMRVSRDTDTPARLGGEEFALLLANIDTSRAAIAAERLRVALSQEQFEELGSMTVSIGVAGCPDNANSDRSLYAASDQALYVAKNEGRNRVAVAPLLQQKLPGV